MQLIAAHVAHRIDLHAIVQAHKVNAFVVIAIPAIALDSLAKTPFVLFAVVDKIVLAGNIEHLADPCALDTCAAVSNSAAFEFCVMSPVWIMKSGAFMPAGTRLILSIALVSVPVTSGFAPLLKPMWLSLICTNVKSAAFPTAEEPLFMVCARSLEAGTPPTIDHNRACAGPCHASKKIPPVDAIARGLHCCLAVLHYFVFFEPIHTDLHPFVIAYTPQN
jgi:hypothetical protein